MPAKRNVGLQSSPCSFLVFGHDVSVFAVACVVSMMCCCLATGLKQRGQLIMN
jgi:hypothetical protein